MNFLFIDFQLFTQNKIFQSFLPQSGLFCSSFSEFVTDSGQPIEIFIGVT